MLKEAEMMKNRILPERLALHDGFLLLLLAGFVGILVLQVVYAQPQPCVVSGWVMYDTGSPCYSGGACYCNITNITGGFIGSARPNNTGYYSDTVNMYNYSHNITVNCTDGVFQGLNYNNCTGGKVEINVTVITPEFPAVGDVPGFILPLLIAGGLCVSFIRLENNP